MSVILVPACAHEGCARDRDGVTVIAPGARLRSESRYHLRYTESGHTVHLERRRGGFGGAEEGACGGRSEFGVGEVGLLEGGASLFHNTTGPDGADGDHEERVRVPDSTHRRRGASRPTVTSITRVPLHGRT